MRSASSQTRRPNTSRVGSQASATAYTRADPVGQVSCLRTPSIISAAQVRKTRVVGTPMCEDTDVRNEVILPATKSAPMLARIALDDAIPPPELKERFEDARLAISEIVTNALLHGGLRPEDTIRLVIAADDDLVRAEVEQVSSARDAQPIAHRLDDSERPGGFGLHIVEATADEWGVDPGPPGHVWFEFRR